MTRKDKDICRIWDIVANDHPGKTDEWRMQLTCDLYNAESNDEISHGDVADALEQRENSR